MAEVQVYVRDQKMNVVMELTDFENIGEYENITVSLTRWRDRYVSLSERAILFSFVFINSNPRHSPILF